MLTSIDAQFYAVPTLTNCGTLTNLRTKRSTQPCRSAHPQLNPNHHQTQPLTGTRPCVSLWLGPCQQLPLYWRRIWARAVDYRRESGRHWTQYSGSCPGHGRWRNDGAVIAHHQQVVLMHVRRCRHRRPWASRWSIRARCWRWGLAMFAVPPNCDVHVASNLRISAFADDSL